MKNINQILKENFTDKEIEKLEKEAAKRAKEYMELKQVVAQEIKAYLDENNLSFNELKEKLDTSTSQVQRIITGRSNFTLETLIKVGNLIGKRPKIIFE
ncbi:helix-turn-helix domain-containing protein [Thiotrichales bacterium 19S9-12]|nr:helix-turn-helix domain-containing protein [Thiotrichales bacterium 19S9-11]MCF6811766.1 helix-turn-helix domain-containing protein [Thiotrichales bacterium 19S9-12]